MPPVFGPASPSSARLKSWAGSSGSDGRAVGDREQRDLRAVEELLDDDPLGDRRVRQRLVAVVGHHDALAGREPVVLDDVRRSEGVERARRPPRASCTRGPSRWAPRRRPSPPWRRPWSPRGARPRRTGRSRRSRRRGRRPRPRRPAAPRGRSTTRSAPTSRARAADRRAVDRVDGVQRGDRRDARVARGGMHLGDAGVAGQGEGERVLAAAAPDDQDLHQPSRSTIVCSRPGPTPTAQNGAPDISSSART